MSSLDVFFSDKRTSEGKKSSQKLNFSTSEMGSVLGIEQLLGFPG